MVCEHATGKLKKKIPIFSFGIPFYPCSSSSRWLIIKKIPPKAEQG
jgi:hypothetical protein